MPELHSVCEVEEHGHHHHRPADIEAPATNGGGGTKLNANQTNCSKAATFDGEWSSRTWDLHPCDITKYDDTVACVFLCVRVCVLRCSREFSGFLGQTVLKF